MWRSLFVIGALVCAASAARAGVNTSETARMHSSVETRRFTYSESRRPRIRVQAELLCDIALQDGEKIHDIFISDSARWKVSTGWSGPDVSHVVVKPTHPNLRAALTIMTDRRAYHIDLVSTRDEGAEFVAFFYPAPPTTSRAHPAVQSPTPTPTVPPQYACTGLDASYTVSGAESLRPRSTCNDGAHTFVNIPERNADLPVLKVIDSDGRDVHANYSFDNVHNEYTVDGTPERLVLIRGRDRIVVTHVHPTSPTPQAQGRQR